MAGGSPYVSTPISLLTESGFLRNADFFLIKKKEAGRFELKNCIKIVLFLQGNTTLWPCYSVAHIHFLVSAVCKVFSGI